MRVSYSKYQVEDFEMGLPSEEGEWWNVHGGHATRDGRRRFGGIRKRVVER